MMIMETDNIADIRKRVENSFSSLSSGVNDTIHEMDTFIKMIDPYVDYFFSGKEEPNSFIGDIVNPARSHLTKAISGAVKIMASDSLVHETVFNTIKRILPLQENVDKIVAMLEAIEIYSLNTMVISAKAGQEGQSLATISSKMAQLSQQGNSLSVFVSEKMKTLIGSLDKFTQMRDRIEGLHDNNLTMIQLASSSQFKNLFTEFNRLSNEVMGEYEMTKVVNNTLKKITEKFQHHDLVRQGLEKVEFVTGLGSSPDGNSFAEYSGMNSENMHDMFGLLVELKICDISRDINTLRNELENGLGSVSSVLDDFTRLINLRSEGNVSGDILDKLCDGLEKLKSKFQEYIDEILFCKQTMQKFLKELSVSISEFASFFDGMRGISHTFKTIILMTRIDLARHDKLKGLLGGALSDVSTIPDQINSIISAGMKQYENITVLMDESIDLYRQKFEEQREVLEESTKLINNVSVQVFESKKYHDDFLREISGRINTVHEFMLKSRNLLSNFHDLAVILEQNAGSGRPGGREKLTDKFMKQLGMMIEFFSSQDRAGDYRSMMMASLSSEFRDGGEQSGTIEFF